MVRYKKAPVNPNVQDRRGAGGISRGGRGIALGGGGLGIGALLLILFLNMCMGGGMGDLGGMAGGLVPAEETGPGTPLTTISPESDPDAQLKEYMSAVYADNDVLWEGIFAEAGRTDYRAPTFVFFDGFTNSACGGADEAIGPHYCPLDETIYVDFGFFTQLRDQFGATGDLAPAYVISHEFGHHIQTVLGVSEQVRNLQQQNPGQANQLSVGMELQADCFAGVWLSTVDVGQLDEGFIAIDPGEMAEAIEAAEAVGDDRIQKQATGMVNPESWTHGSAAQRAEWLQVGADTGDPGQCDAFSQIG